MQTPVVSHSPYILPSVSYLDVFIVRSLEIYSDCPFPHMEDGSLARLIIPGVQEPLAKMRCPFRARY